MSNTQATTAMARTDKAPPKDMKEWISRSKGAFKLVLPAGWSPDRFVRIAQSMLSRDPKLEQCDPRDLILALITIAQLGLEPNGPTGEAYIIPFNTYDPRIRRKHMMPTVVIGFRGLLKLMWQSGQVEAAVCECVYENDTFDIELGSNARIVHKPMIKGDRGPLIATYMVTKIKGATSPLIDFMTRAEIDAVRATSKGYQHFLTQKAEGNQFASHPWDSNYGEMARKTQIRRGCKDVPMSTETSLARALDVDGRAERGAKPVIDVEAVVELPPELGVTAEDARADDDGAPQPTATEQVKAAAGIPNVPAERPALPEKQAPTPIEQELAKASVEAAEPLVAAERASARAPAAVQRGTRGMPAAARPQAAPPAEQPYERQPGDDDIPSR